MRFFDEEGREVVFLAMEPENMPLKAIKPTIITRNAPPKSETAGDRSLSRKYLRPKDLKDVYGISDKKALDLAKEAKAIYKVDKIVMINVEKFEKFLETFVVDE